MTKQKITKGSFATAIGLGLFCASYGAYIVSTGELGRLRGAPGEIKYWIGGAFILFGLWSLGLALAYFKKMRRK